MRKLTKAIFFLSLALAGVVEAKLAPPKLEGYTHVCKKCGKTTHYPTSEWEPRSFIVEYRKGCATLRELGLDVALDESVLCRHCVSAEKLGLQQSDAAQKRLFGEKATRWKLLGRKASLANVGCAINGKWCHAGTGIG